LEQNKHEQLKLLFENWSSEKLVSVEQIPPSGSYREYYRMQGNSLIAMAVFNEDVKENLAFIEYSRHFKSCGLNVPEIYKVSDDNIYYLQQDLGDMGLFPLLLKIRDKAYTGEYITLIKRVLDELPRFQITGHKELNYSVAYPRDSFDRQSMMWDLNYFKYYFLKLARIPFDEQLLEDDFNILTNYLLEASADFFLFRDFQSSNIIIYNNEPYFIDYQGGRKGALQYDLASFLFDAKADFPADFRTEMLEYYTSLINKNYNIEPGDFNKYYYCFVLVRIMQAMGAFGFRGFYEKKPRFLQSIPYALKTLKWLMDNVEFNINTPTLFKAFDKISSSKRLLSISENK